MSQELLPTDMRDLIVRYIDSVAHLEALLFLRAHQADSWTATVIARRLYAQLSEITSALAQLCADGFVRRDGESCLPASIFRSRESPSHLWP